MSSNVKKLLFILFFFSGSSCFAQQPDLYFRKITTGNGLSHNKVNCLLQDKRGFIWIGTEDGLNRYDGNNFLIFRYKPGFTASVSGNIITDLLEDEQGIIWIATADGGLTRYDHRAAASLQFKQYKNLPDDPSSIPVNIINALQQDRNGMLWLATSGRRVIRFNKRTEKFDEPVTTGIATALALSLDTEDKLWVGRQGGGLLKVHTRSLHTESDERYQNLYAKLPHVVVTSLFTDSGKNTWFGSWDKMLYKYDPATKQEMVFGPGSQLHSFAGDEIDDFAEDQHGYLWMAGRFSGLHVLDRRTGYFYNYQSNPSQEGTLADNNVNCVFIDRNNNLWAGTDKGVSVTRLRQQFIQQFLPGPGSKATIYDIYKDKDKTCWIGTSEGIFSRKINDGSFRHIPLQFNGEKIAVTKFFTDVDGTMYLGTNYSLFRFTASTGHIELLPNTEKDKVMNHIIESRVVSVIRDTVNGNPVLLTSPYGHFLAYYDLAQMKWVSRLDSSSNIVSRFGIRDNLIRKFFRSADGNVWLANVKDGLGHWGDPSSAKLTYYKNNPNDSFSLSNNHVFDMTDDGKGNLWVTTYGGGLQHFNIRERKFRHLSASGNLLEGVQTDASGNVWMIGGGNLQRYDSKTGTFSSFELPDINKSGGVTGYLYKDEEGNLFAAGTGYIIQFQPEGIADEWQQPEVIFTGFRIFNDSYSNLLFDKKIRLRYTQNYFTIEFAAPYFSGSEKIRYSYKLDGVNKDWVDAGATPFASYPNTGSGHFTFRVRASVGSGQWVESATTLQIEVIPPFWKRPWFYIAMALLVAGAVYAVYRYRVNELLKRQAIRNKIAQDLHDNIGSTLSSISVYSQVAKIQSENNEKQNLEELLGKISDTSNEMITEMNDTVWAINPRNDSMEKIIQRMESYTRPLLAARNIRFIYEYDKSLLNLQLEMETRKNFYLIFKEAVNNAIKYSGASALEVTITRNHKFLELLVKDNGVGFNLEKELHEPSPSLSGNGLRNMKTRAREMKAELEMTSSPGSGSRILLRLSSPD